ncbi:MAG: haloacid dehalogenase-like hydrolase [Planctomycetota bacterium]|nr:haloacid dehalogenase-like hydrolase [Planctomycetota bacterium]
MRSNRKWTWVVAVTLTVSAVRPGFALEKMNWAPRNHAVLAQFLRDHGQESPAYNAQQPPYAVFDWDDTSAFHDCGEALFRHQLWNLKFRLDKDQFRSCFQDAYRDVQADAGSRRVKLGDVHQDVIADYAYLHDRTSGRGDVGALDDLRATPQFQDFVSKMLFLYEAYTASAEVGPGHSYVWMLYFLSNFTPNEVREIARTTIQEQLGERLREVTWRGPRNFVGKAGPIDVTFPSGLRVQPEMQNLMASLRAAGIDVYIVTASLKQVIEVFAGEGFGYSVPTDHVLGMELEVKDGQLQPAYKAGWVQTHHQGKVEAIRSVLGARGEPVFAAGDSDGDYEMLSGFEGTQLALVLNRVKGGKIGTLCRQAVERQDQLRPRYLLQGRDENTGLFLPTSKTIRLGQSQSQLLK